MSWLRAALKTFTVVVGGILLLAHPANSQTVADFYAGKTIDLTVGYAPGGNYDLNARLIAPYLGKYIPGHPAVVVRNVPGAGGLTQANHLYNVASRDGTAIGILARDAAQAAVLGEPGPRFDPAEFNWLGSSSSYQNDAYLLFIRSDVGESSLDALRKSNRKINFGAGGSGSSDVLFANIVKNVLHVPLEIIKGYSGAGPILLAMQAGEVDCSMTGFAYLRAGHADLLDSKRIIPIVQFGRMARNPDLPNTPTARESVSSEQDRSLIELSETPFFMALPFAAPPNVPADRIAMLRKAFMELHKDPGYLADARKLGLDVSPVDGTAVQKLIEQMAATPREVIERYKGIMSE